MTLSTADRFELSDLVSQYAAHVDDRRFDDLATLFTGDGVLVSPEPPEHLGPHRLHQGHQALVAAMTALQRVALTQHAIVGHVVRATPDGGADGRVACIAHHLAVRSDGQTHDTVWHLRYLDSYRPEGGRWRFARRAMYVDWIENRKVDQWQARAW